MSAQLIVLDVALRNDAKSLIRSAADRPRMLKAPKHLRDVLVDMTGGFPVNAEDACNAVFVAAVASVSMQGTSSARRTDSEACARLWNAVREQMGIDVDRLQGLSAALVDLNDPKKVEAWLAS